MTKYLKISFAAFVFAVICWILSIAVNPSGFELILPFSAIVFSLIFICFTAISIVQKLKKDISPFRIFALADGFVGLCVLAYAIYDIQTSTGWFAGLVGMLLLIFVIPIIIALLVADFLVWLFKKRKTKGMEQYERAEQ